MRPKLPAAVPSAAGGTDSQKSSAGGGAGESEVIKRIEKAIAAVMAKGGAANDVSNRAKKTAERVA
eukprot:5564406-Prymnesium_polylepis.1